jgi:hypothetical protein
LLIYNYASLVPSMGVPDIAAVASDYSVWHASAALNCFLLFFPDIILVYEIQHWCVCVPTVDALLQHNCKCSCTRHSVYM